MNKISSFFSENKTFVSLLIGCICLMALFVSVAIASGAWPGSDASSQILSALAGAVVAAIITLFLLLGQTSSEEKKERNTKIFEERLRIYQEFLHKLCDVVKDLKIEPEEEIELEFQVAYIAMHTSSESIMTISDQVRNIVVNIKKGESDSNEILSQLFIIADTFYKELYGKENDYNEDNRTRTIVNFNSILVAKEDLKRYENDQKESVIKSLSNKDLNLNERALLLQAKIDANGSKQWIWDGTTLVHEFYTDISEKTGNYIKSRNLIAIDMQPVHDYYEVTVFTRQNSEEQSKKMAEEIWGEFKPWKTTDKSRHLYMQIPLSKSDDEIASIMTKLLSDIRSYRNKTYKTH